MAAIDAKWEFSDAQSVSADAYSTNVIDLGNLGISYPQIAGLWLNCILTTGFTSCTSIDVLLRTGTGVDGTPDLNAGIYEIFSQLILSSDRSLATTAGDGTVLVSHQVGLLTTGRYIQVYYDVDTPAGTAVIDCYMGLHKLNAAVNIQESPA